MEPSSDTFKILQGYPETSDVLSNIAIVCNRLHKGKHTSKIGNTCML